MREHENHGESNQPVQIQKEKQLQPIRVSQEQKEKQQIDQSEYLLQKQRMDDYFKSVELLRNSKKENTRQKLVRSAILQNLGSDRYAKIDALKVMRPKSGTASEKVKLNHSAGAKLMAEGRDVIEFDVSLNDHKHTLMSHKGIQDLKTKERKEEKVKWFNNSKFLTWTGLCRTKDQIEKENERIRQENNRLDQVYGETYKEKVAGKSLKQLRHKSSRNETTGAHKNRFTIIGSSESGKYSVEDVEKYILELGKSVLKERLSDWDWKEDEELKDFKKVTIALQGYDAGGVAVSLGAMRIKRWIAENYPRFLDKIDFNIIQYDPTTRQKSPSGKKAEIDLDPLDEKKIKKDPRYMALGENANTTVVYSLHAGKDEKFTPQMVKGAKRVILTMGDHSVNLEQKDQSQGKITRQTYFAEKDGKVEAFRSSGLGELGEGIYIADDNGNLIRLKSMEEYDALAKTLLKTGKQDKRHEAVRKVVENWFGLNGDELAEGTRKKKKQEEKPAEKQEERAEEQQEEKPAEKQEEKAEEQQKFEKDVKQLFLDICSQIHDPNYKGEDEIWSRIGRWKEDPNKESVTYRQLRAATENVKNLVQKMSAPDGSMGINFAKKISAAELLDAMNRLSETANVYYDTHRGHRYSDEGKRRRAGCDMIREMSERFYSQLSRQMGGETIPAITEKQQIRDLKVSDGLKARKRMEELAAQYGKWKKHFARREGCERTSIRDRAALFETFERDIEIYKASYGVKDWPKEIEDAIKAANYYKFQNTVIYEFEKKTGQDMEDPLISMTRMHAREMDDRKVGEKGLSSKEIDRGLKEDQLRAIEEIDRWFIRNYNNAGMAGRLVQIRNHHGEVISTLLKKTKRERLFIYYLIETGKRKSPDVSAAFASQINYTPDLSRFKDQMLASKLKVMSRIFGDYVYMHKLAEAMQINEDYQQVIRDCTKIVDQEKDTGRKNKKKKPEAAPEAAPKDALMKADQIRTECLKDLLDATKEYRDKLEEKQKAGVKDLDHDEELIRLQKNAGDALSALLKADNDVDEASRIGKTGMLGQKRPEHLYNLKDTNKDDIPDNIGIGAMGASAVLDFSPNIANGAVAGYDMLKKYASNVAPISYKPTGWRLAEGGLAKFQIYSSAIGATSVSAIGEALTAICCAYYFAKNADSMHAGDIGMNVATLLNSAGNVGLTVGKGIHMARHLAKQTVDFNRDRVMELSRPVQGVAVGIAVVTAGIGAYSTIAGSLDMMNTKNAAKLLRSRIEKKLPAQNESREEKKEREAREAKESPEEKKKRLTEQRRAKFDKNMLNLSERLNRRKISKAALDTAGALTSMAGLFLPGVGMVSAVFKLTNVILSSKELTGIRTMLFDEYFDFENYMKKAESVMKKRKQEIYNMDEFKDRMRRNLAASLGYADMYSACDNIVKRYADQVCMRLYGPDGMRATDPDEIEGYIQLAKSFGLPVDLEKHKPPADLLARKMNAK